MAAINGNDSRPPSWVCTYSIQQTRYPIDITKNSLKSGFKIMKMPRISYLTGGDGLLYSDSVGGAAA